ncbi:MAG TPA: efflux RND transporter periplasmic adaptor subunit [Candidatus Polarisedimenticolia bacterium]|nr:efflux RND transporter periplasmic adaptor subunit [Candidatus Polarisedimenticolia bacterium]
MSSKSVITLVLGSFVLGAAVVLVGSRVGHPGAGAPAVAERKQLYHCPMHPTMVSDQPGDCPICQMRLVPIEEPSEPDSAAGPGGGTKIIYRSTMNPSEVSDSPGKDSMGMEMVPVEVDSSAEAAGPAVAGRAPVKLTGRKWQLIGVRTARVERRPASRTIRAVGRVTYDETRLHHIHTKVAGWIERLYANATGELVTKGHPLLTIYSPELVSSAEEYLLARRTREELGDSEVESLRRSGEGLVESARRRLLLFDVTPAQIEALETRGEALRTLTLFAPVTGHIIVRNVQQGQRIDAGTNLLDIADLGRVWVLADIYEYELPFVRQGQRATMSLSYLPGRRFEGRVDLIYPMVSEQTRTVKVRIEFPNPDLALKPDMFAEVELHSDLGDRIVIPDSAVISSGQRDVVFVDLGDGTLAPREIKLGVRLQDEVEVLEGISEGESLVVSGNFLIDSESRLKAALNAAGSAARSPDRKAPAEGHPPGHVD